MIEVVYMKVDEQILQIVSDPSFDRFTTFELKKAFEEKVGEDFLTLSDMFKFIFSQMKLLAKAGMIERSRNAPVFSGIYAKTDRFQANQNVSIDSSPIGIKEKHKTYKQQLLIGIGEAQEYQQLCKEYPELKNELQPKYNKVRDQNSRVLGKIRVIESLLNKTDAF